MKDKSKFCLEISYYNSCKQAVFLVLNVTNVFVTPVCRFDHLRSIFDIVNNRQNIADSHGRKQMTGCVQYCASGAVNAVYLFNKFIVFVEPIIQKFLLSELPLHINYNYATLSFLQYAWKYEVCYSYRFNLNEAGNLYLSVYN